VKIRGAVCLTILLVFGLLSGPLLPAAGQPPTLSGGLLADRLTQRLRARLEAAEPQAPLAADGDRIQAVETLPTFYEERLYRPAWVGAGGLLPAGGELLAVLGEAGRHGLDPGDYHTARIAELLAGPAAVPGPARAGALVDVELLLTDGFLLYGAHLVSGRVNPETFDAQWRAVRREVDLGPVLRSAADFGTPRRALEALAPADPAYGRLQQALALYRGAEERGEDWPAIPDGPTLRLGDRGPRVAALAARLRASGDLSAAQSAAAEPDLFDAALEDAVRRFQNRHGLEADGVVGEKTLEALAVPLTARLHQLELNLERWRWLPRDLGPRYVLVDIPAYTLVLVEGGRTELSMRVVVGRSYRRTPVFSDTLRYLVLNPFWEVPTNLAVQDKLPEIRKDLGYLERMKIHVYEGWGSEEREIDPATVDWSKLGPGSFPYRLRQDPGPLNALGRIKFMFPNKYSVYLHDTPSRELFARADRGLSSGCIRIEKPLDLAVALLRGAPGWDRTALEKAVAAGEERMIPLPEPVPVHILYWTAAVDPDGTVRFRPDLYDRDAALDRAFHQAAPGV
jgi:murein L,D-transpeptidase YcbB/YkuD